MRSTKEVAKLINRGWANCPRAYSQLTDIQVAAGSPPLRPGRRCTIHAPSKTAMSSGMSQTIEGGGPAWRIALETEGKWSNPLVGWTSTADHSETVMRQMYFPTKDAAMAFASKHGWEYEIAEPAVVPKHRPRRFPGYGSNFDVNRLPGGTPVGGLRSELNQGKK